jgi:hypothetical protein
VRVRAALGVVAALGMIVALSSQATASGGTDALSTPGRLGAHAPGLSSTSPNHVVKVPKPKTLPTATRARSTSVKPADVGQSDPAWVNYYNNPQDQSNWQAFCIAEGASGYVVAPSVVPYVPGCTQLPDSVPLVYVPGCSDQSCTGDASGWSVTSDVAQCAELVERFLYLKYGWQGQYLYKPDGSSGGGGDLVRVYAQKHPGEGRYTHNGQGSAPAAGDAISFSNGSNPSGHTAIVTSVFVSGTDGIVWFFGQNQGASHTAVVSSTRMTRTSTGWTLAPWSGYKTSEWLHVQPIIMFNELPLWTSVTNQYQPDAVVFSGATPFTSLDGANPTSPVLSGTPQFQGTVVGRFVAPAAPGTAPVWATVRQFHVDIGYIDNPNSTELDYFDASGKLIGSKLVPASGINGMTIISTIPIGSFQVRTISNEPNGWAIDNLAFPSQ